MGVTKLQARLFLRNLLKIGITAQYVHDIGRQRITKYVSKKFEKNSTLSKQFNKEMHKIKELTKKMTSENEEIQKKKDIANSLERKENVHVKQECNQKSYSDDHNIPSNNVDASVVDEDTHVENRDSAELKNKFYVVNNILRSYRLTKLRSKYRCTALKSLALKEISKVAKKKGKSNAVSIEQIANNAMATSLYNSIKTNLTMQKPVRTGSGVNEVFGFMEVMQNGKKSVSNITYRFVYLADLHR